jgi:tRNA(Ile)-lysidine synthase
MPKNQLRSFLSVHHKSGRPLLVGVSGGADSLTLLFALHELGVKAHVAHLDHGWREESADEARALEKLVREETSFPFHTRRVQPAERNREAHGRRQRLAFFKELCDTLGCEAVLLGHHADDQAETVLKRMTEGAALHKLVGMAPTITIDGVALWRPFLKLPKQALGSRALVDDPTNRDPAFQRSRLRHAVLPALGKGVERNLGRLGDEARLLADYLDSQIAPLLDCVEEGPLGRWLAVPPLHPVERRHLVRSLCPILGPGLSREALDTICRLLEEGKANARVEGLEIDRGRLFLPNSLDSWEVAEAEGPSGWAALWAGGAATSVPMGEWRLGPAEPGALVAGQKTLSHWFNKASVPAFLRKQVPVIWSGDRVVGEFLTGRPLFPGDLRISLTPTDGRYKKSSGGRILSTQSFGRNLL